MRHALTTLSCALLSLLLTLPAGAAAPKVVADQTEFQFGQIHQGEKVEHAFSFTNKGSAPLVVEKVRASCGCTAAHPTSRELDPGERGEIRTTFDSTRFRGKVSKTIYLYTNDPAHPVIHLYIRGTIKEEIVPTPNRLHLGVVPTDTSKEATVTLTNQGEAAITFGALNSSAQEISLSLSQKHLPPGETAELRVRVRGKKGKSRIRGFAILEVSGARVSQVQIPVYAEVR